MTQVIPAKNKIYKQTGNSFRICAPDGGQSNTCVSEGEQSRVKEHDDSQKKEQQPKRRDAHSDFCEDVCQNTVCGDPKAK